MIRFNYRKICFQIHKWLSLFFSLPFLLLAISGFIISLKPEPRPLNVKSPVPIADVLLKLRSERSNWTFPRVNFNRDYFTVYGLHEGDLKLLTVERRTGSLISEEDPSRNIFFSFQTMHESFYLETFGKRLVGLSGFGLALVILSGILFWTRKAVLAQIQKLFTLKSIKTLKGLHLLMGVGLSVPLLYAALTGFMIVFDPYREKITPFTEPEVCTLDVSLMTIRKLFIGERGTLLICRPQNLITLINEQGIVKMLPSGEKVFSTSKSAWSSSSILRRQFFTNLHDGSFFGVFRSAYNFIIGLSLLLLTSTGLWIWLRKTRKSYL